MSDEEKAKELIELYMTSALYAKNIRDDMIKLLKNGSMSAMALNDEERAHALDAMTELTEYIEKLKGRAAMVGNAYLPGQHEEVIQQITDAMVAKMMQIAAQDPEEQLDLLGDKIMALQPELQVRVVPA